MSHDQSDTRFKVSKSTISGIIPNREKYEYQEYECVKLKKIRGDYLEIEKAVIIWLKSRSHTEVSISGNRFKEKAPQFEEKFNISDFRPSDRWLDRCKKRNSITFRYIVGESSPVSPEIYTDCIKYCCVH